MQKAANPVKEIAHRRASKGHAGNKDLRIAVSLDESFNFYYADNFETLERNGVNLVFFSPVNDPSLPTNIDGLILGGGFPEVVADKLEVNLSMHKSILEAAEDGLPIYAECGGLMYLTKSISGYKGNNRKRKMVGLFDAETEMTSKLTLNYTLADCNGAFFGRVSGIRGHEFHYSKIDNISLDSKFAYIVRKGAGIAQNRDGLVVYNCLASYMHVHFTDYRIVDRFLQNCINYSRT
jgi:cobyrinic acid a,c-diamide synthase